MAERWCKVCGGWHDLEAWPAECMPKAPKRSDLAAPMLIRDEMRPVQSQLDGKFYDSKSALRSTYKTAGVVEVGNDSSVMTPAPKVPKVDRKSISQSVDKALQKAGFGSV